MFASNSTDNYCTHNLRFGRLSLATPLIQQLYIGIHCVFYALFVGQSQVSISHSRSVNFNRYNRINIRYVAVSFYFDSSRIIDHRYLLTIGISCDSV